MEVGPDSVASSHARPLPAQCAVARRLYLGNFLIAALIASRSDLSVVVTRGPRRMTTDRISGVVAEPFRRMRDTLERVSPAMIGGNSCIGEHRPDELRHAVLH